MPIAVWALMPLCLGALKGRKFVRVIQIQEVDEVVDANKEGAVMLRGKFGESCIYGKSIDIEIIKDVINKQRRAPLRSVLLG